MKSKLLIALALILAIFPGCVSSRSTSSPIVSQTSLPILKLPEPRLTSQVSLEETLSRRRSVREYSPASLSLNDISQLLWSAQGVTSPAGGRTAPSAGGIYPLEFYLVAGNVDGLNPGSYRYQPAEHGLILIDNKNLRKNLSEAALSQTYVAEGAIDIVISAIYDRITPKYGDRGIRYSHLEAGHAAQNVCLQAVSLNLGTVTIGAFDDKEVQVVLHLAENETPLYILPVGKIK